MSDGTGIKSLSRKAHSPAGVQEEESWELLYLAMEQ